MRISGLWPRTVCRAEYQLQYVGNTGDKLGIPHSLCQVGPTNAHTGTERTLYTNLSRSIKMRLKVTVSCIITGAKTWCQNYEPESEQQSLERQHEFFIEEKVQEAVLSGKVMCMVFWNGKDHYGFSGTQRSH